MGLFSALFNGGPIVALNPMDERYWTPYSTAYLSSTGITITPDLALGVSCIFQGCRLIAETIGSLPLDLFRRLDDGGKEPARTHPLWEILHDEPNAWQTSQEFREVMTTHAILWGNAFAQILPGPRGFADELVPIDPDRVTVEQLSTRRLRYQVRRENGTSETLVQEQVFRLRGPGPDRLVGSKLLWLARQAIGVWLAQEKFNAVFFRQGARPSLSLKVPQKLSDPAYQRLKESINERLEGLDNMHRVLLAEEGSEFTEFGFSARNAQMTEAHEAQVLEIARWLNIPEHMLRAGKQPTFASVEQFAREFIDYTIRPWATRWEQAIRRDLIVTDRERVFARFLLDALLRGNTLDRAQADAIYITNGVITRNEVRIRDDRNPLPGLDAPLTPLNLDRGGDPATPRPSDGRMPPASPINDDEEDEDEEDEENTAHGPGVPPRARLITQQAAARVVKMEAERIREKAIQYADDSVAWATWVRTFYARYERVLGEHLQLAPAVTAAYCAGHQAALLARGILVLEEWETTATRALTALALEEAP